MRNLKKVLAMALALVMSLSLVTIANAADFSDDADISYKEAVDVMSAIGVINGYEDGSFQPDGVLTREEAAKLICTLLLGDGSDKLGTTSSSFTDVASTRWSSPYIEYCNSLGIIAGNGDGTFDPTGELTGHAFAKMLLVALGYDSAREGYTGAGWSIEVAKDAITAGIDVDGVAMSAEVTREVAAQMAFNTLEATMVEYATAGTVVTAPDGTTVVTSGSNASKVENNANRAGYDGEKDGYQQFCEEYFDDLEKNTSATDKYSRPAVAWEYDNEDVGTYAKEADATYTEATEVRDIYSDLGLSDDILAGDIDLFVDGETSEGADYVEGDDIVAITRRGTTEYGKQGAQMDVYYDDEAETVTICIVNTYLGIVTDDDYTQDGDDGILVEVYDDAGSMDGTYFLENGAYDQDTVLLVQVAADEIQAVVGEPETVTGSISRISSDDDLTIDGTVYAKANAYTVSADNDVIEGKDVSDSTQVDTDEDITYILYLDQYDNYLAIAVDEDNSESDLVYIYGIDVGTVLDGNRVKYGVLATVVRMDGTVEELLIGEAVTADSVDAAEKDSDIADILKNATKDRYGELSYDEDDDTYDLKNINAVADPQYTAVNIGVGVEYAVDDNRITSNVDSKVYYLNSDTTYIFITENDAKDGIDDVEVITGGIDYKGVSGKAAYTSGREVQAIVFLDSYESTNDNVIFFKEGTKYSSRVASDVYGFKGYLLGSDEKEEFSISKLNGNDVKSTDTLGGFYTYTETSDGYLRLTAIDTDGYTEYVVDEDSYVKDTDLDEIKNGILVWTDASSDEQSALVSNAVVVDLTDADKPEENRYGRNVTSVSTLQRVLDNGYTVTVSMFVNEDNEVEAIFITKIADGPDVDGGGDIDPDGATLKLEGGSTNPVLPIDIEDFDNGVASITVATDAKVIKITVTEPDKGDYSSVATTLTVNGVTYTPDADYTVTQSDLNRGYITVVATTTFTPAEGENVVVENTYTINVNGTFTVS